jgi:DNA-binding transcriptional MerR regulator
MTEGSGCTPRTVRYYEREGLLRAQRSAGGHRLFAASELERLNFIISLREAGWSLDEVTQLLGIRDAADSDARASGELEALVARHVQRLDRKIEVLRRLRDDLHNTAQLLPVCRECTTVQEVVECEACERVPTLDRLPRAFRLIWRARELAGAQVYDEQAADVDD